jgi:hypothetical protein
VKGVEKMAAKKKSGTSGKVVGKVAYKKGNLYYVKKSGEVVEKKLSRKGGKKGRK